MLASRLLLRCPPRPKHAFVGVTTNILACVPLANFPFISFTRNYGSIKGTLLHHPIQPTPSFCNSQKSLGGILARAVSSETAARTGLTDVPQEKRTKVTASDKEYLLPHPIWSDWDVSHITKTHHRARDFVDSLAYGVIQVMRFNFDVLTGYKFGKLTERKWVNRLVFLETVAGVPGSVGAVVRHLHSLRTMRHDHGWIHTLLEEAENERMHLMTFIKLQNPGLMMRASVFLAQGVFYNFFFLSYLISPRFCHRMVGYLEEEAVTTYSKLILQLEQGELPEWQKAEVPEIAKKYWKLDDKATLLDLFRVIRADEAHHRDVNHRFADMKTDEPNPYGPGE